MSVIIGSARANENGKLRGGKPGDQTGREVSTQEWYPHPKGWIVLRAKDRSITERIARNMEAACRNRLIGYDQEHRERLFQETKRVGFDCRKVSRDTTTDCSALVRVCVSYAGVRVGDFYTGNEKLALLNTEEFQCLSNADFNRHPDLLHRGDILVTRSKGHTVVVLSDGRKAAQVKAAGPGKKWVQGDHGEWMYHEGGKPVRGQWRQIDGRCYVFDEGGVMIKGWFAGSDGWYLMGEDGAMLAGQWDQSGSYYLTRRGVMAADGHVKWQGLYYPVGKDGRWTGETIKEMPSGMIMD